MLILSSPAFQDHKPVPTKYANRGIVGGRNISIPLRWVGAPADTASFALSIVDPHPVARNWVHWMVVNIPFDCDSLPEDASGRQMPQGSKELYNGFGTKGYGGPQPPAGTGPHQYVITLFALRVAILDLPEISSLEAFTKAIVTQRLETASLTGSYER